MEHTLLTSALPALVLFAFVTSITPGPNNLMLLASGANFGSRESAPHIMGISIGHGAMIVLLGIGLVGAFDAVPGLETALKVLSLLYLLYLAWKIGTAAPPPQGAEGEQTGGRPMTFVQAAAFQWVNPKGWAMALTALAAYAPDRTVGSVVAVAVVFALVNLPSVSVWALGGQAMRRVLQSPTSLRLFNIAMATLLVVSSVPIVLAG